MQTNNKNFSVDQRKKFYLKFYSTDLPHKVTWLGIGIIHFFGVIFVWFIALLAHMEGDRCVGKLFPAFT